MSSPSTTLRQAAQRIRQGWCQHKSFMPDGRLCANGSISIQFDWPRVNERGFRDDPRFDVVKSIVTVLQLPIDLDEMPSRADTSFPYLQAIARWNDAPGQTAENVASALEYVALILDQQALAAQPVPETADTFTLTRR